MNLILRLAVLYTVCWAVIGQVVIAQETDQRLAVHNLMGEYDVISDSSVNSRVGVQLTFLGNNTPKALLFVGGLPGIGWDQSKPIDLKLESSGLPLKLQGNGFRVEFQQRQTETTRRTIDWNARKLFVTRTTAAKLESGDAIQELAIAEVTWPNQSKTQLIKVDRHGVTLGQKPPRDAIVLFGDDAKPQHLVKPQVSPEGYLMIGTETDFTVQSFRMHVEFRIPYMPDKTGQGRGNSGIYVQRRYEVQVLDSFGFLPEKDGCGSLYKQRPPDINMSAPPGKWQTYDLFFEHAQWDACGNKTRPAHISVIHNGVPVHYRQPIVAKTGAGKPEGPEPMPILFQDHGDPVVYRNVWLEHR